MIISSGLGFLAAVITFGACLISQLILDAQFEKGFYSSHLWAIGTGLALGGIFTAIVGLALKSRNDREVVDVRTGERLIVNLSHHTFFFIPMHWAGLAIALFGLGLVAYDCLKETGSI